MKEKYKKGRQRHKETAEELHNIEKKIAFVKRKKRIQCARAKKKFELEILLKNQYEQTGFDDDDDVVDDYGNRRRQHKPQHSHSSFRILFLHDADFVFLRSIYSI